MNFLAHLYLAGDDDALRLGAMLGDFVRGRSGLERFPEGIREGILLHRHIDSSTDSQPGVAALRSWFPGEFRRYAGIILDLAFDHELALRWPRYSGVELEAFDLEVRGLLNRHRAFVPEGLGRFMAYADRRGLFAAYRETGEILHSLQGVGRRLSHPNPLHRAGEIWPALQPLVAANFGVIFARAQSGVEDWLKSRSTMTGS